LYAAENLREVTMDELDQSFQTIDKITATAIDMAVRFGPRVLAALLVLTAGYFASRWAGRAALRTIDRFKLDPPVRALIDRMVRLLVLGLFFIMALQNLGVELLPLIAGLGVAGAGIALAMQGVLGNLVAGLSIIFSRPFRVGDYISIVNEEGEVLDITIFTTTLGHADLSRVVIPNRKIVGEILHNYGRIRQVNLQVGISYDTDINAAVAAVEEVLLASPRVLRDPKAPVRVTSLADSCVTLGISPWVEAPNYGVAGGELYQALLETFRSRRIEMPFPQREIRMLGATASVRQGSGEALAGRNAA